MECETSSLCCVVLTSIFCRNSFAVRKKEMHTCAFMCARVCVRVYANIDAFLWEKIDSNRLRISTNAICYGIWVISNRKQITTLDIFVFLWLSLPSLMWLLYVVVVFVVVAGFFLTLLLFLLSFFFRFILLHSSNFFFSINLYILLPLLLCAAITAGLTKHVYVLNSELSVHTVCTVVVHLYTKHKVFSSKISIWLSTKEKKYEHMIRLRCCFSIKINIVFSAYCKRF